MPGIRVMAAVMLAGWLCAAPAIAADPEAYFIGEALQSDDRSETALIREAFEQVLAKLTGRRRVDADPRLQAIAADALRMLLGFSYREERAPGNVLDAPDRYLQARFDRRLVLQKLRAAGVPLWNLERPEVLLWLAIESPGGERRMLGEDDVMLRYVLGREARQLGLPLLLPVQDHIDYAALQPDAIWGGFHEQAIAASRRYAADQIVIATAAPSGSARGGGWHLRWRLVNDQGLETFTGTSPDLYQGLAAGLGQLTALLARQQRIDPLQAGVRRVLIQLPGLGTPADLGRAWGVLAGLSQVQSLAVRRAGEDGLFVMLELTAGADWLRQAIKFHDELTIMAPAAGENAVPQAGMPDAIVVRIVAEG